MRSCAVFSRTRCADDIISHSLATSATGTADYIFSLAHQIHFGHIDLTTNYLLTKFEGKMMIGNGDKKCEAYLQYDF